MDPVRVVAGILIRYYIKENETRRYIEQNSTVHGISRDSFFTYHLMSMILFLLKEKTKVWSSAVCLVSSFPRLLLSSLLWLSIRSVIMFKNISPVL